MCNREFASKDDLSVKICLRRKHFDPEFEGVLLHVTDIIRLINAADISLFINSERNLHENSIQKVWNRFIISVYQNPEVENSDLIY